MQISHAGRGVSQRALPLCCRESLHAAGFGRRLYVSQRALPLCCREVKTQMLIAQPMGVSQRALPLCCRENRGPVRVPGLLAYHSVLCRLVAESAARLRATYGSRGCITACSAALLQRDGLYEKL